MNKETITKSETLNFFADIIAAIERPESISTESAVFQRLIVAQPEKVEIPNLHLENSDTKTTSAKVLTLTERLNKMISEGAYFEISADEFQAFGVGNIERKYLETQKQETLCFLQQNYLQKHLFNHSPELLEAFKTEVVELSATMTDGIGEIIFEAICKICADWITEALENGGN